MSIAMNGQEMSCGEERRREDVRAAQLFGLDYVEVVDPQQLTLNVFFLGKAPTQIDKANVTLTGGRRIRDVQIVSVRVSRQPDPTLDDYLELHVNKPGDFSDYTISMVSAANGQPTSEPMEGFDSRYSTVSFSFKASCPTDLDCKDACRCAPPHRDQPEINYLAKDYESFRQLMLDRLSLTMPAWSETHAPDLGVTLVEVMAYAADYLSYYQDAVATEAYLGTARQRISVRRHARLVDYPMHDGCNARAWLTIDTDTDQQLNGSQIEFITAFDGAPLDRHLLTAKDLTGVDPSTYEVFEPLYWNGGGQIAIFSKHSRIPFYTWGNCECCLATGATSATLADGWAGETPAAGRILQLKVGDVLVFEEVLGPKTGQMSDADPTHRQAVRLTSVTQGVDPLYGAPAGTPIVEIEWASEDALTFPLCFSSRQPPPECGCLEDVSVARGNVILVDHGSRYSEVLGTVPTASTGGQCPTCCEPSSVTFTAGQFRPPLTQEPLTSSVPLPPPCSSADFTEQDPQQALPWISLRSIPPAPTCSEGASQNSPPPPCVIPSLFTFDDISNPADIARSLKTSDSVNTQFLLAQLSPSTQQTLAAWDGSMPVPAALASAIGIDLTDLLQPWAAKRDLLESGPSDFDFVVEIDDAGYGHVRFGDGVCGRQPDAGTLFRADYRVGNGVAGNVGADTITYMLLDGETISGVNMSPRNPLAAADGTDPEPIDDVKFFAPYAFKAQLERAITADDYAAIAADNERRLESRAALAAEDPAICAASFTRLQGAKADLRWTGSWYTARVALDPAGEETVPPELLDEVTLYLEPFRRMGCDMVVESAQYVPLRVGITVCVLPNYLRGHVEAAVLDALSNRTLPDGTIGFFHPDNLSFGDGIYVSRLLAAVQAIAGVQNATVTELERLEISSPLSGFASADDHLPMNSALLFGPFEIPQLDNDPDYPEHGLLVLDVRGGR